MNNNSESTVEPNILKLSAVSGQEILRFEANGDIYVKGKLIENDLEVVNGFRELLNLTDVN